MSKLKTFKDITWKKQRIKSVIQGLLMLNNGRELSITAGEGLYSIPGGLDFTGELKKPDSVSSFEVAIFNKEGEFEMDPIGWQSREDIDELVKTWS